MANDQTDHADPQYDVRVGSKNWTSRQGESRIQAKIRSYSVFHWTFEIHKSAQAISSDRNSFTFKAQSVDIGIFLPPPII